MKIVVAMKAKLLILCFLSILITGLCISAALAQATASLELSASSLGMDDQLTLSITVTGSEANSAEQPDLSGFEGFRLVAGPSVSTQFQWINGRTSSSKTFSYVLLPLQQGEFTLGPFKIVVGKDTVTTNSARIKVIAGSAAPPTTSRRRGAWAQRPSLFDEPAAQPQTVGEEVFVAAEPDKLRAYPGQQITLVYKVYTQLSVSGLELKESPPLKGFWVEDIEVPRTPTPELTQVRQRQYSVFVVKKQALFANSPGRLQIPVFTFALGVRVRTNDPFSFFNFGTTEPVYRRTAAVDVTILPFPQAGKPSGFKGLAGHFSLSSKTDKTEAKTGDALALTVTLSGAGNFNTVGDIELPELREFKVFSSKSNVKTDRSGDLIQGTKTWEFVIVPQVPGTYNIPSLSLAYFDPETEKYHTAATEPLPIRVTRSEGEPAQSLRTLPASQRKLTRQGSDINFIKLAVGNLEDQSRTWQTSYIFYMLLLLPLLANAGIFIFQRRAEKLSENIVLLRRRRASKRATQALKSAAKNLRSGMLPQFHSALAMALSHFLADRFGLPEIDLTRDQLQERLSEAGISQETIDRAIRLLDRCDFARFAPSQVKAEDAQALLQEAQQIITQLEKASATRK